MSRDYVEPGIAQEKDAGDHGRRNCHLPLLPERPCCRTEASQQDDVEAGPGQRPGGDEIAPRQGEGQADCPWNESETTQGQEADDPMTGGKDTAPCKAPIGRGRGEGSKQASTLETV